MTTLLLILVLVPGLVVACYPLFIRRVFSNREKATGGKHSATISIIVPCCGLEERPAENITALLSQKFTAASEVLFCVESPSDPAVAVLEPLLAANGDQTARLIITGPAGDKLGKMHNLIAGYAEAHGDRLVLLDSDVLLPDDHYLDRFTAALEQPGVGLVTCYPAYREFRNIPAAIMSFMINNDLLGLFALMDGSGELPLANGSCLAVDREVLVAAGGLVALQKQLLMDTALARNILQTGATVRLYREGAPVIAGRMTLAQTRQQSRRWHLAMWRVLPPLHYCGYAWLRSGVLLGSVVCLATGWQPLPVAALAFTLTSRLLVSWWLDRHHLHSGSFYQYCWLLPVVELCNGWDAVTAPLGREITWRGRSYILDRNGQALSGATRDAQPNQEQS